jgi:hypothetical protein
MHIDIVDESYCSSACLINCEYHGRIRLQDGTYLESQSNDILTGVVGCMQSHQPSDRVRQVATRALLNSIEFCRANFEREAERHVIMQVRRAKP